MSDKKLTARELIQRKREKEGKKAIQKKIANAIIEIASSKEEAKKSDSGADVDVYSISYCLDNFKPKKAFKEIKKTIAYCRDTYNEDVDSVMEELEPIIGSLEDKLELIDIEVEDMKQKLRDVRAENKAINFELVRTDILIDMMIATNINLLRLLVEEDNGLL